MPLLKFKVTKGADPDQVGVGGEKVPCPFCGKDMCFVFSDGMERDGVVIIELTELSALMQANVTAVAHIAPDCGKFKDCMSRDDATAKADARAIMVALLKTGQPLPQVARLISAVEKPAAEGVLCDCPQRDAIMDAISKQKPGEGIDPTSLPRCGKPAVLTVTSTYENMPEQTRHFCERCRPRRIEPPTAPSYRGISGRALAHLLCLDRLEAHVMVCDKRVDECERSETLTRAFQGSLAALHPRDQRRVAQIGREMAKRVMRARGN
jgi:hypothetical protein